MTSANEPRELPATKNAAGTPVSAPHIRNAQVRFAQHEAGRGSAARIAQKTKRKKAGSQRFLGGTYSKEEHVEQRRALSHEITNFLETEGVEFLEKEIHEASAKKERLPSFPVFMFTVALIKDIIDVPAELTIIGIILTTALSFAIALVLFFWFLGKMSGRWWKGKMVSWFWKRCVLTIALEFIPFFKIIPATTVLVLMAHFRETKTVKILNGALERLHSAKFKFDFK